jgi:hypothetical protein
MNKRMLLGAMILAAPLTANAQVTTLDYQGSVMSGTSDYLPTGFTQTNSGGSFTTLPTAPVIGSFTASITLDGSFGSPDLTLTSFNVTFNGNNGTSFSKGEGSGGGQSVGGGPDFLVGQFFAGSGTIDVTPTGATINISSDQYHANQELITIGPTGDSFSWSYGTSQGSCANLPGADGGTYTGSTINPCDVNASSSTAGIWKVTQTPEIDPASAASGLALLLGGTLVLTGRRAKRT